MSTTIIITTMCSQNLNTSTHQRHLAKPRKRCVITRRSLLLKLLANWWLQHVSSQGWHNKTNHRCRHHQKVISILLWQLLKQSKLHFLNIYKWSFNFSKYISFQWSNAELLKGKTCIHQPKGMKGLWERPQYHPDQLHRELLITSDREMLFLYSCRFHTAQICVLVGTVLWEGILIQYGAVFSSVWSTDFPLGKIC